jgi:hypothetical protein
MGDGTVRVMENGFGKWELGRTGLKNHLNGVEPWGSIMREQVIKNWGF